MTSIFDAYDNAKTIYGEDSPECRAESRKLLDHFTQVAMEAKESAVEATLVPKNRMTSPCVSNNFMDWNDEMQWKADLRKEAR